LIILGDVALAGRVTSDAGTPKSRGGARVQVSPDSKLARSTGSPEMCARTAVDLRVVGAEQQPTRLGDERLADLRADRGAEGMFWRFG